MSIVLQMDVKGVLGHCWDILGGAAPGRPSREVSRTQLQTPGCKRHADRARNRSIRTPNYFGVLSTTLHFSFCVFLYHVDRCTLYNKTSLEDAVLKEGVKMGKYKQYIHGLW